MWPILETQNREQKHCLSEVPTLFLYMRMPVHLEVWGKAELTIHLQIEPLMANNGIYLRLSVSFKVSVIIVITPFLKELKVSLSWR